MYNLSLPNLCAMLRPDVARSSPNDELNSHTARCGVFYSYLCRRWQNGISGPFTSLLTIGVKDRVIEATAYARCELELDLFNV